MSLPAPTAKLPRDVRPGSIVERVAQVLLWLIVLVCCALPMAWLVVQLATHPQVLRDAVPDGFRWWLIVRTFGFNGLAATLATGIAIPMAIAISNTRSIAGRVLGVLVCVPLLMPSLVLTYGWKQVYAVAGLDPMPQSAADVTRCIIALSSWIWPIPALTLAFALRRVDANLMLQARLDGVAGRILARLMAGPLLLGFLAAMLLSLQEFAIFEPSGISVIATEVRAVFETGSSLNQQWSILEDHDDGRGPTQEERTGAALAVMLPSLLATVLFAAATAAASGRLAEGIDWQAHDDEPRAGRSRLWPMVLGYVFFALVVGVPVVAMIRSLHRRFEFSRIVTEFAPQLVGSSTLGLSAAAIGTALLIAASVARGSSRPRWLAIASFLVGGQWTAIALIVIFNRPGLLLIYDSYTMPILAYVCRFAWIPLCAAGMTWSSGTRWLRDLAATDGADASETWHYVIAPLAWPLFVGAAVLMFMLSMTEVPATTLLQPAFTLVPMLMTWAHILNYDAMIEASLLLAGVVLIAGVSVALLVRTGARWMR